MQALVNLPAATTECVHHLSQLLNTVNESINTFTSLDRSVGKWDDVLIFFIESKLAASTRMDWAKEVERKAPTGFPVYKDIRTFIEDRIRTLDLITTDTAYNSTKNHSHEDPQRHSSMQSSNESKRKQFFKRPKSPAVHVATQNSQKPAQQNPYASCGVRKIMS